MATKKKSGTKVIRVAPDPLPIGGPPLPIDDKSPLPLYKEVTVPDED